MFPGKNGREVFVVAQSLAVGRLMFFPKMSAARFITGERVGTKKLSKLEEVGHATGPFERLIKILAIAGHERVAPEFFPELGNFCERFAQALRIPRHTATIP